MSLARQQVFGLPSNSYSEKRSIRLDGYDNFENPFNKAIQNQKTVLSHILKNGFLVPISAEGGDSDSADSQKPPESNCKAQLPGSGGESEELDEADEDEGPASRNHKSEVFFRSLDSKGGYKSASSLMTDISMYDYDYGDLLKQNTAPQAQQLTLSRDQMKSVQKSLPMFRHLAPCAANYIFERLTTYSYSENFKILSHKTDELDFLYVMTGSIQFQVECGYKPPTQKPIRFALVKSQHICQSDLR